MQRDPGTRTVTLEAADFSRYRSMIMFFAKGTLLEKSSRHKSFSRRNLFAGGAWSSTASCVKGTAISGAGHACVGTRGSTMNTSRHPSTFAASPQKTVDARYGIITCILVQLRLLCSTGWYPRPDSSKISFSIPTGEPRASMLYGWSSCLDLCLHLEGSLKATWTNLF